MAKSAGNGAKTADFVENFFRGQVKVDLLIIFGDLCGVGGFLVLLGHGIEFSFKDVGQKLQHHFLAHYGKTLEKLGADIRYGVGWTEPVAVMDKLYADAQVIVIAKDKTWAQVYDPKTGYVGFVMLSFLK